jgi:predicted outer membrane repeat protein
MKRAIVFVCILFCAPLCLATTIRVPADQPTIHAGIIYAVTGDTVLVAPGTYSGRIHFIGKGIVVTSIDGPAVTFLESQFTPMVIFDDGEPSQAELSGFTIRNSKGERLVSITNGAEPLIQGNIFTNLTADEAIIYCENTNPRIIRNLFYSNSSGYGGCIETLGGTANIINNTLDKNSNGIYSYGATIAENNIVTNSTECGFDGLYAILGYNDDWNSGCDYQGSAPVVIGWLSEDPLYVDPIAHDYRLQVSSPCVNAGDPDHLYDDPNGTRNDLGAFPVLIGSPIPKNIDLGAEQHGDSVATTIPTIRWQYFDAANTVQAAYELEVGTDDEWTVAEMWNTGVVETGADSVTYAGSPLSDHNSYYLRLRLFNGADWGEWSVKRFFVDLVRTVRVPEEQPTIQQGIDAATNRDTVLIADGHYYERINYHGKNIVVGSYFLIDGDTMHIANTVIDGDTTVLGVSDGGSVVSFVSGEDSTSLLAGITIINGFGRRDDYFGYGGGILCGSANPSIEHCHILHCGRNYSFGGAVYMNREGQICISDCSFIDNRAYWGGAIYSEGASVRIVNCVFANNSADAGGALFSMEPTTRVEGCRFVENRASVGGAILGIGVNIADSYFLRNEAGFGGAIKTEDRVIVTGCRFEENRANGGSGGAISCNPSDSLRIANCLFTANSSSYLGGAFYGPGGFRNATIVGCTFMKNLAPFGGAVYLKLTSRTNALLDSSVFDGNTAISIGGAIVISSNRLNIRSCSFVRNSAPKGSWLANESENTTVASSVFEDCLVAFNRGGPIVDPADSAWFLPTISCSNFYGNEGGDWISYIASQADSNGNISADPLFCDTASGNFHLRGNSRCAPANNSCGVLIGALPVACGWGCGDIDGSGGVNITDAVRLIYYLFANGPEPLDLSGGDVNQDGHLNVADVVYLINYIFVGGPAPCAVGQ